MIDWLGVARGALWIIGLSVALAAWSDAGWQAGAQRLGLRQALSRASFQAWFNFGLLLFAAGMAWGAAHAWQRIVWLILTALFIWQAATAWRRMRSA